MGTADLLQMLKKTTGGHVRSENFWSLGPWKRLGDLPKCGGGRVSLSAGCLMFNGEEYDHPTSRGSDRDPLLGHILGWVEVDSSRVTSAARFLDLICDQGQISQYLVQWSQICSSPVVAKLQLPTRPESSRLWSGHDGSSSF